jgi:sugar-specific transcriptional regulator TrmB
VKLCPQNYTYINVNNIKSIPNHFPFFSFFNLIGCGKLSLDRVFKALVNLGLSETDAQVYIYLATKGPAKARKIVIYNKVSNRQIYRSLKRLHNKKIIRINSEYPTEFTALPFDEVLDMLIEMKKDQAQAIRKRREKLLSGWRDNAK